MSSRVIFTCDLCGNQSDSLVECAQVLVQNDNRPDNVCHMCKSCWRSARDHLIETRLVVGR